MVWWHWGARPIGRGAHEHLVGGRATATAEALYAAVAIGELDLARELFAVATDPNLYFHEIFNVFRVWALGLWLARA